MNSKEKLLLVIERGISISDDGVPLKKNKPIKMYLGSTGYYVIKTKYYVNKKQKDMTIPVHRIQAYQIYGDRIFEPGIVVRHLNSNRLDNKNVNIAIGTPRQNSLDMPKEKRLSMAYHASESLIKYDDTTLLTIKRDKSSGLSYRQLADKFNTSKSEIWYIVNKRTITGHSLAQ